jgi:electron transfer flavoprotein alpha subunit
MSILVIAEHDNENLKDATAHTVAAAAQLGEVTALIAGHNCRAAAEQLASLQGVSKVLLCDNETYQHNVAENLSALVVANSEGFTHLLAPATTFGKNLMPRIAALLDVAQISDVIGIESSDTFKRPIYAGNAIATIQSTDSVKVMTVRGTSFEAAGAGDQAEIQEISAAQAYSKTRFIKHSLSVSDRPELTSAKIIVSGGRGVGSAENFSLMDSLANKLGAAVGASRAAVDAGYVPNDYQVGQTGKIVAPDLYIAIGISGAIQHLAGMKESKVIVAINKDEEAPIFQVADYGLVGDLFEVVPQLIEQL